jgi:hypothetical protein
VFATLPQPPFGRSFKTPDHLGFKFKPVLGVGESEEGLESAMGEPPAMFTTGLDSKWVKRERLRMVACRLLVVEMLRVSASMLVFSRTVQSKSDTGVSGTAAPLMFPVEAMRFQRPQRHSFRLASESQARTWWYVNPTPSRILCLHPA